MQFVALLFCLVVTLTSTKAASISGMAGIDRNSAYAQTRAIFPRIPGINAPLSSLFPFRPQSPPPPNRPSNRPPPPPPQSTPAPSNPNDSTSSPSNNSTSSTSPNNSTSSSSPNNSTSSSSPNNSTSSSSPNNSTSSSSPNNSTSPSNDLSKYFDIPSSGSLVPDLPQNGNRSDYTQNGNRSDVSVPSIPGLPDLSELPKIPGLSDAIEEARHHLQDVLQLGNDIPAGIEKAIEQAFDNDDPVSAVRTIIDTIIQTYRTIAENCPAFIIGSRVLQEGIRLAIEAASSARNVITGSTSSPIEF